MIWSDVSDSQLKVAANNLQDTYKNDVGVYFSSEMCSFRCEFKDELKSQSSVLDVFKLLMSSHVAASVPELTTVCALVLTQPVTVASADRSFSKLKLIKTYLRSTTALKLESQNSIRTLFARDYVVTCESVW